MAMSSYRGAIASGGVSSTVENYAGTIHGRSGGAPLAYWRLGSVSQLTDEQAGARHGTYNGVPALATSLPQASDDAIQFSGGAEGIVPHDSQLLLSSWSLSLWFKMLAFVDEPNVSLLWSKDASGLDVGGTILGVFNDQRTWLLFQDASQNYPVPASEPLELNRAYHLVVRGDATGMDAYLDGKYLGKAFGASASWASNANAVYFASSPWKLVDPDIVLDEVALYDYVLTEPDVIALAQKEGVAPVAADASTGVPESATTTIPLPAECAFVGSKAALTVTVVSQPGGGDSVSVDGNNDFSYTAGAVGADTARSFTYKIQDSNGESSTATISVAVQDMSASSPLALCYVESGADTVEVTSAAGLASAIAAAPPGRNILVAPGTYTGGTQTIDGNGAEGNPIVVRPRDGIGTVTFNQPSWTYATGSSDIVLSGLRFNGGRIRPAGTRHRITRCRWRQISDRSIFIDQPLTFSRIDHCDFAELLAGGNGAIHAHPNPVGTGATHDILIDYNYFHDMVQSNLSSAAVVAVTHFSTTASALADSNIIIDQCLFDNIDLRPTGEDCVLIKCGGVVVRFCTFTNLAGQNYIQTRMAAGCQIRSNWVEGGGSMRCWGPDHLFIGNRLVGIDLWAGSGTGNYPIDGSSAFYYASVNGRFIGNVVDGSLVVGAMWSDQLGNRVDQAEDNVIEDHTGTIDTSTHSAWHVGTVINSTTNESYTPAVKLTSSNVGLAAPDPLCPSGPQS